MAKASRKLKAVERATVLPEAARHGRYGVTTAYIARADNDDYGHFRVSVNLAPTVIDGWISQGGEFFSPRNIQIIRLCRDLWDRCPMIRKDGHGGASHTNALSTLASLKRRVPRFAWEIFENVCRWDEPTGVPGSRYSAVKPSHVRAAKHVVRYVAEEIFK